MSVYPYIVRQTGPHRGFILKISFSTLCELVIYYIAVIVAEVLSHVPLFVTSAIDFHSVCGVRERISTIAAERKTTNYE